MIKNSHNLKVRHSLACDRVIKIIDQKPQAFKGMQVPVSPIIANDKIIPFRNVSIAGIILAFFVKVFH